MVTLQFLALIKIVTFRIATALFALILVFFSLHLVIVFIKRVVSKIKTPLRTRIRNMLLGYMLGEIGTEKLTFRSFQKGVFIEVFSTMVSLIKGNKQDRLKEVFKSLGLIPFLERSLSSISPVKRLYSCRMLGLLESKPSADAVTRALFDSNPKVASAAIIALGEIREEKTIPALLQLFSVCSFPHAWLITAVLSFFGKGIYEHLKPYLKLNILPEKKLILLLRVVGELQLAESIEELKTLYSESESLDVRIASMNAIGMLNDLFAVKIILDALTHSEWQLRAVACRIIGEMSLKGAAYRLIPLLKDSNFYVRKNAANALVSLGKLGITAILAYLDVNDRYARDMIAQTLIERGIVDRAIMDLEEKDEKKRNEAVMILKLFREKGYTDYLKNFCETNPFIGRLIEGARD